MIDVAETLAVLFATIVMLGLAFVAVALMAESLLGGYTTNRARRRAQRRKGYMP